MQSVVRLWMVWLVLAVSFCLVTGEAAARDLPRDLRRRVEARSGRHIIDPAAASGDVALRGPTRPDHLPHAWHPVLWRGGRSGAPILYVSEQQSDRVETKSAQESRELLEALFAHLYSPRFL